MVCAVIERFEQQAPASVMARLALEQALPAHWIDEVFETHRQRQYPRELLFSTVVELMTLVSLGLRPRCTRRRASSMNDCRCHWRRCTTKSIAASRQCCALVQGSAQRLAPLVACLPGRPVCPAGNCACWTATTCPPVTRGWPRCAVSRRGSPGPHAGALRPGQCLGVRHRGV